MSDPSTSGDGIPGRIFVPIGLALVFGTFVLALLLFFRGPKGAFTDEAAGPRGAIGARIEAKCGEARLAPTGRCPAGARLTVTARSTSEAARYVTWTLFGKGGVIVRSSPVETPVEVELDLEPGPYMLAAIVGDEALDTKALPERFGGPEASVDPSRGLDVVETFAGDARRAGRAATVTRLPIVISDAQNP